MRNKTIRAEAKQAGVHLWQIAEALGITDASFSRKLRKELPEDQTQEIIQIIRRLAAEKEAEA